MSARVRDAFGRIDRAQHALWFKVAASVIIAAIGIFVVGSYAVKARADREATKIRIQENPGAEAATLGPDATEADRIKAAQDEESRAAAKTAIEMTVNSINQMLSARTDLTAVAVGVFALVAIALGVVWIGQALTALGILLGITLLAAPLIRYGSPTWSDIGKFVAAVGTLTLSFVVLMQLLRLALSGPHPTVAIARNVVNEAVRIKVSLVFIVLLLFALAALPGMLDAGTPLRYRVQSFLQYGTGGTFWIIAVLVLFLAVSSVTFEQRDRVIWQTMTKPVASWQYLLGKWLGTVGVAAVLLAVSATGVFLFTEYLRDQRAIGEFEPYRPADGSMITEDRFVLESQVLTARDSVQPDLPPLDEGAMVKELEERVRRARQTDQNFEDTDAARAKLLDEYLTERRTQFFAIAGGQSKEFSFSGLRSARERGAALTLRYKVDVGANDPKVVFKFSYQFPGGTAPVVVQVPLGQVLTADVVPSAIDSNGRLYIKITNGDALASMRGEPDWANDSTMSFPPEGFEVFYAVSGYHANFARVVVVLWLKLAFLAMVGVCASTFLSFSVAALVSFGTFIIAESSKFLFDSLEYYASTDTKGNIDVFRVLVRLIAVPISRTFHYYSSLRPTANLVDGRLVGWSTLGMAILVLGLVSAVLYAIAVMIFRRRELAMYSGN